MIPCIQDFRFEDHFTNATLKKAIDIVQSQKVQSIKAPKLARASSYLSIYDENDVWKIVANVKGAYAKKYRTTILFDREYDDESLTISNECNCPVGFDCKHAAAAIMILKQYANASSQLAGSTESLPNAVRNWLASLESTAKPSNAESGKKSTSNKLLAYCLEINSGQDAFAHAIISARPASRLKSGEISLDSSIARADPMRPAAYMNEDDIPICTDLHRLLNQVNEWGHTKPIGRPGANVLLGAIAADRLFLMPSQTKYGRYYVANTLKKGPTIPIRPDWKLLSYGNAKPILAGLPENGLLLPTDPLLYIDLAEGLIGHVEHAESIPLLRAWCQGPEIPANSLALVSSSLVEHPILSVPPPKLIATEQRPAVAPIPHLTIAQKTATMYGIDDTFTVAHLAFQYGDSPLFPYEFDKEPTTHHRQMIDDSMITWPRMIEKERAHLSDLKNLDLIPIASVFSVTHLGAALRQAFIPANHNPNSRLHWFHLLDSPAAQAMRAAGWVFHTEESAGLHAHEVEEFTPAIEPETDHGIDWFRFDVSFEIDGKSHSLIPLIAFAIQHNFPSADAADLPETLAIPCENPADGFLRLPAKRFLEIVDQVRHLFIDRAPGNGSLKLDRLAAAGIADGLSLHSSETTRALANLGKSLKQIHGLPPVPIPSSVKAELRPYQAEGFRWLNFLAEHQLNGILADDMGLGKTLQTLTHLAAAHENHPGQPSLVIAPTSVVHNWEAEAKKFTPHLKTLTYHGNERTLTAEQMADAHIVFTSYPLLHRDIELLSRQQWHSVILDEAQHIKNPKSITARAACALKSQHRLCLSGTPMENHLGELWSLMHFLMPGLLPDEKNFNATLRKPIERDRSSDAQLALNRRVSPLILRRTKDQVASDLPAKTEIIHHIELTKKQIDLYESVRATMDKRVREALAAKGLAKSHIIVLDALLKLRQICCHPQLLKTPAAEKIKESAKLSYLTDELLPPLLEEGRRILLFSQFTSMLAIIEEHLTSASIPFLKLTGQTKNRSDLVKQFQTGQVPLFLISLRAGGTGLNLTAADTVIHYDPWWNPAAENQATDRAHRIGQEKPVFVHKLVCRGSIEDRILELQSHKSALVKALLSEETTSLRIDQETLSHLFAPLG